MPDLNKYYWITKDNKKIAMMDMEPKHLQYAHTMVCRKEYEYFERQNLFNALREMLELVAEERKILISYPDQRQSDKKWGKYFCAMRSVKSIVPETQKEAKEPVLASNQNK